VCVCVRVRESKRDLRGVHRGTLAGIGGLRACGTSVHKRRFVLLVWCVCVSVCERETVCECVCESVCV
jgi:hypothetical protein